MECDRTSVGGNMVAVTPWTRRWCGRLLCLVLAVVSLAGCALTLTYRHADWLIEWQADHYFDLSSGQRKNLRARTQQLLRQHRVEALPRYAEFLGDFKERVRRGLTRDDLDWAYAAFDRFRLDLVNRALPDTSALLNTVTASQVRHIEQVLHREEQKARESMPRSSDARGEARADKALDWARKWVGPLAAWQKAQLRTDVRMLPDMEPVWLESRSQRRNELLALLRQPGTTQAADGLRRIVSPAGEEMSSTRLRMDGEWRTGVTAVLLRLDGMLTLRQRQHLIHSIEELIDDIRTLSRAA